MFVFLLLILISSALLILNSRKNLKAIKNTRTIKWLLSIGVLSVILCILFGYLGNQYIQTSQMVNSSCPTEYPYAWTVVAVALIGLFALLFGAVLAFRSKQKRIGYIALICAVDLVIVAGLAWLFSVFCLTF